MDQLDWKDSRRPGQTRPRPVIPAKAGIHAPPKTSPLCAPARSFPRIEKSDGQTELKRWSPPQSNPPRPVIPAKAGIHAPPKTTHLCAPARSFPRKDKSDGPTELERWPPPRHSRRRPGQTRPRPVIPAKAGIHTPPKTPPLRAPAWSFPRKEKSDGLTKLER